MACCNVTYVIKTVTPEAVEIAFARRIRNALSSKMDASEGGKLGSYFISWGSHCPVCLHLLWSLGPLLTQAKCLSSLLLLMTASLYDSLRSQQSSVTIKYRQTF